MPFPHFPSSKLKEIDNTLNYPPLGSPEFYATEEEFPEGGERLSVEELGESGGSPETEAEPPGENYDGEDATPRPKR